MISAATKIENCLRTARSRDVHCALCNMMRRVASGKLSAFYGFLCVWDLFIKH